MSNTLKFGGGLWATKEGSTLAYNDENGNFKPLPFDFTRATSGTVVNKDGLIEVVSNNVPRIDFSDSSEGAMLLEPQRSNYIPYSENFSQWSTASGASVVSNQEGVGGSNTAYEFISDGSSNTRLFYALTNTGELSFSVFAKKNTLDYISLYGNGGANPRVWFNLDNGTLGNQEGGGVGSIENYGNGWYRCTMKWTSTSLVNVRIYNSNANDIFGGTAGSVFIQYAQLEQGSYPTSYIPTSGSIGTRVTDVCSQTVPDGIIGQTEGTILFDYTPYDVSVSTSEDTIPLAISNNGSISDSIYLNDYNGNLDLFIRVGGIVQAQIQFSSLADNQRFKLGIGYAFNDLVFYVNGVQIGIDTSLSLPTCNQIKLNGFTSNVHINRINVNDLKLYNTRLSNSELQALTS